MKPVTDTEIAELSRLLTTTRQALSDQNVDEAKQLIAKALELARAPAHVAKAKRLEMLVMLNSEFWRAVDESIAGIEGGDVISVTGTQVAVVEVTPDTLILRVAGVNRRYARADMSEGLAMGLADRWLDQNSEVTPLVRGAFLAVAKQGDPKRAREQWRQAAAKGAEVGDLPQVLDDKYDVPTLRAEAGEQAPAAAMDSTMSEADKTSLANALRAARAALATGETDDADAQLAIARNLAGGSSLEPVVKRTEMLARHARVFWNAVAEGMGNLTPDTTLKIGNAEVTITEASGDQVTYTVFDKTRTQSRGELSGGLAMEIAFTVLDPDSAEGHLARGAYYAVAPNGSAEYAREAWNQAADSADVPELLKTLDDTYEW